MNLVVSLTINILHPDNVMMICAKIHSLTMISVFTKEDTSSVSFTEDTHFYSTGLAL